MPTRTLSLMTPDGPMPAYAAAPDPRSFPAARGGVVVVQEAFGVTSYVERVCEALAAGGWHAVAPHLFHRSGDPALDYDVQAAMPHAQALTAAGVLADVDAALAHLLDAGLPLPRTGLLGFCAGGSVTTFVASRRAVGAAVCFYGGGVREGRFGLPPLVEVAPHLQAPWLGLYGGRDAGIPEADTAALRTAAQLAPVPTELLVYDDAGHAFHNVDRPSVYVEGAAADAWARALAWLDAHVAA